MRHVPRMWQCVAVCCSMFHCSRQRVSASRAWCFAVCCGLWHCSSVSRCATMQQATSERSSASHVAVCCSVLQSVAVCCTASGSATHVSYIAVCCGAFHCNIQRASEHVHVDYSGMHLDNTTQIDRGRRQPSHQRLHQVNICVACVL